MTIDTLIAHCERRPGVTYDTPFGPGVLVFKVAGKIFALAPRAFERAEPVRKDPRRAFYATITKFSGCDAFA